MLLTQDLERDFVEVSMLYGVDTEVVATTFLLLFMCVIFLLSLQHFFGAIGLYRIAKREGLSHSWLAWFPLGNFISLTRLVEKQVYKPLRNKFTLFFILFLLLSFFFSIYIPFLLYSFLAVLIYAFYFIAERYSERVNLHLALAVVTFGLSIPFQLFRFRNREMINEQE